MVALNFNARQVAPNSMPESLPDGVYDVIITKTEEKPTKNRDGFFTEFHMIVQGGEFNGRTVIDRLNLKNKSTQAQEIAFGTLSSICHVTGRYEIQDTNQLCGVPIKIRVAKVPRDDRPGSFSNNVLEYYDVNGNPPGAAGAAGAQTNAAPAWAAGQAPQGGQQQNPQGGQPYNPQQQAPQNNGYPPQGQQPVHHQNAYPQHQQPQQQAGYPQQGYDPNAGQQQMPQNGYPNQAPQHQQPPQGYPNQAPQNPQGGYPNQQPQHQAPQGGYPQQGPGPQSGYDPNAGGYPNQQPNPNAGPAASGDAPPWVHGQ